MLYIGVMFWHAIQGSKHTHDAAEYHVAGRALSGTVIGLSFYASFMSTNSFVGLAGMSAVWGLGLWGIGAMFVVFAWIGWRYFAGPLREATERVDAITMPEFFGKSYGSPGLRRATGLVIAIASLPYLQAVFKGSMIIVSDLTGLSEMASLAVVWVAVVAYTIVGGFHAVAMTDVVQGVIMMAAALGLPFAMMIKAGGPGELMTSVSTATDLDFFGWLTMAPVGIVVGIGFAGGLNCITDPRTVTRFFAIDAKEIRKGRIIAISALVVSFALVLPVGLLSRGLLEGPVGDPDKIVSRLLSQPDLIHPILGAIVMCALLAAAMSTLDSVLLIVGGALQRDVLGWIGDKSPIPELTSTRIFIAAISVVAAGLVLLNPGQIVALAAFASALYAAAFLPPLLFLLHGKRTPNVAGAWAAMGFGLPTVLIWKLVLVPAIPPLKAVHESVSGTVVALLAYVIADRLTRKA